MELKDTKISLDLKQQIAVINKQINDLDIQRLELLNKLDILNKQLDFSISIYNDEPSKLLYKQLFDEISLEPV